MATSPARKSTPAKRQPARRPPSTPAAEPKVEGPPLTDGDRKWIEEQTALANGGDVPAAQAETVLEDIPDGAVAVPLGPHGDLVHVIPRGQWRASALSSLHEGNLDAWAQLCLFEPDYKIWIGVDPTVDEVMEMLEVWQKLTGEDLGKADVQRGSLRNGRRR
jgi:hypothetical protein